MLADDFAAMESAEELFAWLGQPYDPAVLRVHRVRILKRFGRRVAGLGEGADERERWRVYGLVLRQVYDEVAREGALEGVPVLSHPHRLIPLRRPARVRAA